MHQSTSHSMTQIKGYSRKLSVLLATILAFPLFVACGSGQRNSANLPPVDDTRTSVDNRAPGTAPRAQRPRLSNTQKAVITLAGAAALYYLYNRQKNARAETGPNSQYYLSKNGRVYYRDAQKRVHWVTPPRDGIQVPAEEAERYREFQGYDNRPTGRDLTTLPEAQSSAY